MIIVTVLAPTACGPASVPTPTLTGPAAAVASFTPVPPTATATSTHMPMPTTTPTSTPTPTASPIRKPTATPTSTPTPTSTRAPTATPTDTPTSPPTPTSTPTPIPAHTLSGVVFFDYEGDGVQDEREPTIGGATVRVGSLVATSGEDGRYMLQGVPEGRRQVKLAATENFRYIALSLEAFQIIDEPLSVVVERDLRRD